MKQKDMENVTDKMTLKDIVAAHEKVEQSKKDSIPLASKDFSDVSEQQIEVQLAHDIQSVMNDSQAAKHDNQGETAAKKATVQKPTVQKAVAPKTAANKGNKKIAKPEKTINEKEMSELAEIKKFGEIGKWFQTICWMKIPIVGFIYIIVLAVRKSTPTDKKNYARAYILYKALVFILAVVLLYCMYRMGLNFIDGMLQYVSDY